MSSEHGPFTAPGRYDRPAFYRRCGRAGLKLPIISLGLWHNFGAVDAFENSRALIRRAFELGITHFDLANNYGPPPGSAEENFGRILKTDLAGYRDELVISAKAGTSPPGQLPPARGPPSGSADLFGS
jgi:L-glyceraldehyde 3-phosphate reductase